MTVRSVGDPREPVTPDALRDVRSGAVREAGAADDHAVGLSIAELESIEEPLAVLSSPGLMRDIDETRGEIDASPAAPMSKADAIAMLEVVAMADPVQDGPAMNALIHKAVRRDLNGFSTALTDFREQGRRTRRRDRGAIRLVRHPAHPSPRGRGGDPLARTARQPRRHRRG